MSLLELSGVSKQFGGLAAVSNFDLKLEKGELIGLIGPTGAGKSTIFNLISGVLPPTAGKILFKGGEVGGRKPHEIARMGIIRTFQLNTLFGDLTVFQNALIGGHTSAGLGLGLAEAFFRLKRREDLEQRSLDVLRLLGLIDLKDEIAKNLPDGHQRILEIGVAVCAMPEVLLLDEPVSGMNVKEAIRVMNMVNSLREREGLSVLLVEHNMRVIMDYCDRVAVVSYGKKIAEGRPSEIKQNEEVIIAYLGA